MDLCPIRQKAEIQYSGTFIKSGYCERREYFFLKRGLPIKFTRKGFKKN